MKRLLLILLSLGGMNVFSQAPIKILKDTVSLQRNNFVLQNTSREVKGFLVNKGSGNTVFAEVGKQFQFTAGVSPDFQLQGDSIYTNTYLAGKYVKVWRNGLLQYTNLPGGVKIDNNTGKIVFNPQLSAGDRIFIEALNGF
ncbi:hypothetical protein [Chitinophaga arvensicola]|uniref:Uncharacterized protein n=1 Tax=Chitinophaga arvensicola TaxID=29529 RepID=A0A1I0S9F8_9BACT|nr:hypothetical protein [Chitinophaga arvensicola]SEW52809.1 hypothetical protein SAMN04488122_5133 [Chitinophaga arvensicola]